MNRLYLNVKDGDSEIKSNLPSPKKRKRSRTWVNKTNLSTCKEKTKLTTKFCCCVGLNNGKGRKKRTKKEYGAIMVHVWCRTNQSEPLPPPERLCTSMGS
ncbi:hypothetical protein TNCV_2842051 [Trichonephila clavipes]|uniref:Uncharacterized protein n=1 Tax=Trichonephila clavipes TaxID=2585209 RepID=A0A8X6RNX6_TRICX|nr:hypothetical protein TNCV_2842051 [Trichonephila clavipes]